MEGNESILSDLAVLLEHSDNDLYNVGSQLWLDLVTDLDKNYLKQTTQAVLQVVGLLVCHLSLVEGQLQLLKDWYQHLLNDWDGLRATVLNYGSHSDVRSLGQVDTRTYKIFTLSVGDQDLD